MAWVFGLGLLAVVAAGSSARAEEIGAVTLEGAVRFALGHHPSLRASQATEEDAAARTGLLRSGYLPQANVSLEFLRATGNLVAGSVFPLPAIPSVTGPPATPRFDSGAFGSSVGLGAAWDLLSLPRRIALVDAALLDQQAARAGTDAQRLSVAFDAADAYLEAVGGAEVVKATGAGVERARVFTATVRVLAEHDLRPGADLSRSEAELALAQAQLVRAEEAASLAQVRLALTLGAAGARVDVVPGPLLLPPRAGRPEGPTREHPLLAGATAAMEAAGARERAAGLAYLPRVELVAALWSRGSGWSPSGQDPGGGAGLLPDTPNWAAGLVVSWPVLEMFAIRACRQTERAQVHLSQARREEIMQVLRAQIDAARTMLDASARVAQQVALGLQAARMTERQADARYRSGLVPVVEVAEAQRLLAQAETEDAVARLRIHRARLVLGRALGDLEPFLAELRGTEER